MKLILLVLLVLACIGQNINGVFDDRFDDLNENSAKVEDNMLILTDANFEETLKKYPYLLVAFYDPYDVENMKQMNFYKKAAKLFNLEYQQSKGGKHGGHSPQLMQKYYFAKIDCMSWSIMSGQLGIT